jgi:hyperosmotically inducible protein
MTCATLPRRCGQIVKAPVLPAFAFTNGCKSTATPSVTARGVIANDDAALAARVKQALVADPGLRSLPMSVATYRGVVQLSGYVDSEGTRQSPRSSDLQPSVETVTASQSRISVSNADNLSLTSPSASLPSKRCVGGRSAAIAASIAHAAFCGSPNCLPLFSSRALRMGLKTWS